MHVQFQSKTLNVEALSTQWATATQCAGGSNAKAWRRFPFRIPAKLRTADYPGYILYMYHSLQHTNNKTSGRRSWIARYLCFYVRYVLASITYGTIVKTLLVAYIMSQSQCPHYPHRLNWRPNWLERECPHALAFDSDTALKSHGFSATSKSVSVSTGIGALEAGFKQADAFIKVTEHNISTHATYVHDTYIISRNID